MRFEDKKIALFLICACVFLVISVDFCSADKNKHKTKPPKQDKNDQQHHKKNSTVNEHRNNTGVHNVSGGVADHGGNTPDIGWSLHNSPGQQAPQGNPHGYAIQPHNQGHGDHQSQGHPQQHPPQTAPSQDSGTSALGAGVGGLALGALGGAAGGYFLSNALNKDEKSEDKVTETVTETILTTLLVAAVENSTEIPTDSSSTIPAETSSETTMIVAAQNLPINAASEASKADQSVTETPATTQDSAKDKSSVGTSSASVYLLVISLIAKYAIQNYA